MVQVCIGLCSRIKSNTFPNKKRYESGVKWCSLCAYFLDVDKFICPCCKTRLRSKRRNKISESIIIKTNNLNPKSLLEFQFYIHYHIQVNSAMTVLSKDLIPIFLVFRHDAGNLQRRHTRVNLCTTEGTGRHDGSLKISR